MHGEYGDTSWKSMIRISRTREPVSVYELIEAERWEIPVIRNLARIDLALAIRRRTS
jgi:hypothetical protein